MSKFILASREKRRIAWKLLCAFWIAATFAAGYLWRRSAESEPIAVLPKFLRPAVDLKYPCGVTSAAIAGRLVGADSIYLEDARLAVPADTMGQTSIAELVVGLNRLGLAARAVKIPPHRVCDLDGQGAVIFFIHQSHFVAGLPTGSGGVVLIEPHRVDFTSFDRLCRIWTGEVVVVQKDENELLRVLATIGIN